MDIHNTHFRELGFVRAARREGTGAETGADWAAVERKMSHMNEMYAPEALLHAWRNAAWRNGTAMLQLPGDNLLELELQDRQEELGYAVEEVLSLLHAVDALVQEQDAVYQPVGITLGRGRAEILYFGVTVNTQFEVRLLREHGHWFCGRIGLRELSPPLRM